MQLLLQKIKSIKKTVAELIKKRRKTTQPLLPLTSTGESNGSYTVFPSYPSGKIVFSGFDSLAERISQEKIVVIDGFGGVLWELFREHLQQALYQKNKKVFWYDINSCLHTTEEINRLLETSLNGNDPVFGKKYTGELSDFYDKEKLKLLKPDEAADICIVYGTGAALSNWNGLLVYADVPKNEIQYRMRAGCVTNLGTQALSTSAQTYKRFYFADWPVLNKHKEQLFKVIDCIVDEQAYHGNNLDGG